MNIEYAKIIHDIVEQGLDAKYLAHLIERCDTKQVHELVEQLNISEKSAKDPLIDEVSLFYIYDSIEYIKSQIEAL